MASKLPVWGIDVGQCSLKAIKLQATDEGVEMLAADVVEHESIISQVESDAPELIGKAIETFLSRNEIKDSRVVVSVPGQQTLTRFTKMPPVEKKKLPDMVQYEASQQIPFDMDEVVWDYQIFAEDDSPDVEVGIFAIRKELIRNHLTHFLNKGIEPVIVQTSPLASYNAAMYEWPAADGEATILLDMGALATDLIVYEGNRIWSRPVPIGGNRFTEALVSAFKISFRKAERLKRSASTSKYARQVFQAMRPVFADLVSEIQRSIGFYTSTHREARIRRILGMGNAFKLPGLQKFLLQNLQIKVEKTTGFKKLNWAGGDMPAAYTEHVMSFGVAYGLGLQGLGLAAVDANLLPLEVRRTLLWRKKRTWFAASVASLALAAGSLWVGNVMAGNQFAAGKGNLTSLTPPLPGTIDQAQAVVSRGVSGGPVEYGAKIARAAEKLTLESKNAAAPRGGDRKVLLEMAKLPKNNVFVPRILDVVHRAFAEASLPELRDVASGKEYQALARRLSRPERREVWIKGLAMYYLRNPLKRLSDGTDTKKKGPAKPGWYIKLVGETTDPEPTKLVDEKLISMLDLLGKQPNRGFHFAKVSLVSLEKSSEGRNWRRSLDDSKQQGRRDTRRRGRSRVSQPRGVIPLGMTGPMAPRPGAARKSAKEELDDLAEKNEGRDPLTGELTAEDHVFELRIAVFAGDTPEDLIPDAYKEKKEEDGKSDKTGS